MTKNDLYTEEEIKELQEVFFKEILNHLYYMTKKFTKEIKKRKKLSIMNIQITGFDYMPNECYDLNSKNEFNNLINKELNKINYYMYLDLNYIKIKPN